MPSLFSDPTLSLASIVPQSTLGILTYPFRQGTYYSNAYGEAIFLIMQIK